MECSSLSAKSPTPRPGQPLETDQLSTFPAPMSDKRAPESRRPELPTTAPHQIRPTKYLGNTGTYCGPTATGLSSECVLLRSPPRSQQAEGSPKLEPTPEPTHEPTHSRDKPPPTSTKKSTQSCSQNCSQNCPPPWRISRGPLLPNPLLCSSDDSRHEPAHSAICSSPLRTLLDSSASVA